jgi:predicted nucleic acid-binding protein
MIRFWDSSALVKSYVRSERDHARSRALLLGRGAQKTRQVTSMLAAVEVVSALARTTRNRALVDAAIQQLESLEQVEFSDVHAHVALALARTGRARGPDTAIAAQAIVVARAANQRLEFVTADRLQSDLVRVAAARERLAIRVVQLDV